MKRPLRSSIWLKLTIFVGVLVILTSSALIWAGYVSARNMLVDQIHERLTVVASDRQALLLAYVGQQQERVGLVASRTRLRMLLQEHVDGLIGDEEFRAESRRILLDAQNSTQDFLTICIANRDGQVVTATEDACLGQDFSQEPAFAAGRQEAYLGLPRLTDGRYQSFLTGPAVANNGRPLGVVIVVLDLNHMVQLLSDHTALGESGEVIVGTRQDETIHYLLPPRHAPAITQIAPDRVPAMASAIDRQFGFIATEDYRGAEVLAAYRPVGYLDWGMVAKIDSAEAYIPVKQLRLILLAIEAVILLLGLAAAYLLAKRFTRPIMEMASTAVAVGAGDLDARVPLSAGAGELEQLGRAFNEMAASLKQYQEQQIREERRKAELERASQVQADLLPKEFPALAHFELAARCVPAQEVGGDFYDWQEPAPGILTLSLGDVMGKGMPAALLMAAVRAALRAVVQQTPSLATSVGPGGLADADPTQFGEFITHFHAQLVQAAAMALEPDLTRAGSFVTLFHAQLDLAAQRLDYVDAGHGCVFVRRADGQLEGLQPRGMPLGVLADHIYQQGALTMYPGDVLVIYSDGLIDADPALALTPAKIAAQLEGIVDAQAMVERLVNLPGLAESPPDDLTVMVLRCREA